MKRLKVVDSVSGEGHRLSYITVVPRLITGRQCCNSSAGAGAGAGDGDGDGDARGGSTSWSRSVHVSEDELFRFFESKRVPNARAAARDVLEDLGPAGVVAHYKEPKNGQFEIPHTIVCEHCGEPAYEGVYCGRGGDYCEHNDMGTDDE